MVYFFLRILFDINLKRTFLSLFLFCHFLFCHFLSFSQEGVIKGRVYNTLNNEAISFANIVMMDSTRGVLSDDKGYYEIKNIKPGAYNVKAFIVGFKPITIYEIQVTSSKSSIVDFALESIADTLKEIVIGPKRSDKTDDSPLSLTSISSNEIDKNPGGNRDISKVIQSLPGVASAVSFRNDLIIRGGAPSENTFYLDGIQVPNINHFTTQGSSGGPVGMINVNFINSVDFYSGAFPADKGNALSSIFDFKFKNGNPDKQVFTATVGASDFGVTADGHISDNTSYIFSVRRSYLQLLFGLLGLPFLPTYNDAQFKVSSRLSDKDILSVIGLGAIDNSPLNLKADQTPLQQYLLSNLPVYQQWNYTVGVTYRHYRKHGNTLIVLSNSSLFNRSYKYLNNDESNPSNKILDYRSTENELRLRVEDNIKVNGFKINYGMQMENDYYTNSTFDKLALPYGNYITNFSSNLPFNQFGGFFQVSKKYFDERLTLSLGARTDFSDYSIQTSNPLKQISPRFSLSYQLAENISFNFNTGIYYQLPAFTVLGYRDSLGTLVNKNEGVTYIQCKHLVGGFEYNPNQNLRITIEGFYKLYAHYPFLIQDSITLENLGSDFGVIGNAPVISTAQGKSYGLEFMAQQKLFKGFYGIVAYTFFFSQFTDKYGNYVPSSWDYRNIVALTVGKKFKRNWEVGAKWRLQGGGPYTPYNVNLSMEKTVWDITGQGIPNYNLLNTQRLPTVNQLDIRIDKKFYEKKWSFDLYFDVQNVLNEQFNLQPYLSVVRDANGNPVVNPSNPNAYQPNYINNVSGTLLPTIGVIIQF
jgi:hypothetical protein